MGNFTLESFTGEGTTGQVYKAHLKGTDSYYAVKIVDVNRGPKLTALMREVPALRRFGGEGVVNLLDVKVAWKPGESKEDRGHPVFLLFMEAADSSLEAVITKSFQEVTMQQRLRMMVEILRGLDAVASGGFVHRDIKPQNIFVFGDCHTEECHVKIGDFGMACEAGHNQRGELQQLMGSPMYIAPEVWRGDGASAKSDLWSVGMVLYELFTGSSPFPGDEELQESVESLEEHPLREIIAKEFRVKEDEGWRRFRLVDPEIADFVSSLLNRRHWLRPTVRRALKRARALAEARGVDLSMLGKPQPRLPMVGAV